jgi:DNA repair photolyase
MTSIIYAPKGAAKEYADLACNPFKSCLHGCTYCYAPSAMKMGAEQYFSEVIEKENVLARIAKDIRKLTPESPEVLFRSSVTCISRFRTNL